MDQIALAEANRKYDDVAPEEVWNLRKQAIAENLKLIHWWIGRVAWNCDGTLDEDEFYDAGVDGLCRAASKYSDPKIKFCTYAAEAIKRRMIDVYKRKQRRPRRFALVEQQAKEGITDAVRQEVWNTVERAGLSEIEQEIVLAYAYNGNYSEVMSRWVNPDTGKPYTRASAKNFLRRALTKLRAA